MNTKTLHSTKIANTWHILNFDLAVGDYVIVPFVRSGILDVKSGLGWWACDAIVKVLQVMDLTFCFEFNNETHFCLKEEVKKTKNKPSLFNELDKVNYAKDDFQYRISIKYGNLE